MDTFVCVVPSFDRVPGRYHNDYGERYISYLCSSIKCGVVLSSCFKEWCRGMGFLNSRDKGRIVLRAATFLNSYRRDLRSQWTSQNLQGGLYWTCENQLVPTSYILLIGGKPGRDRTIPHEIKQLANYKTNHSRDTIGAFLYVTRQIFFLFLARDRLLYYLY